MTTATSGASIEHEIGPTGRFHLRQLAGDIRVRGVDGSTVRVRERDGRSIAEHFHVETAADWLSLSAPERSGLNLVFDITRRSSLDLDVEVPRAAAVSIETASAEVEAADLTGRLKLRTASGDVALNGLAGTLELDAVSGDTRVTAVGALDVRARTISGDLAVRAPRLGRAEIGTTSGDVRLDAELTGSGPFGVETVSGDVTIVGRVGLRIEARTVTGELRSELPHRRESGPGRKQLIIGDGAVAFTFRSVSGDLRVTTPRDGVAPTRPVAPPAVADASRPPVQPVAAIPPEVPETPVSAGAGGREVARMDVLRALERGELSVEAAMRRIADIEEA